MENRVDRLEAKVHSLIIRQKMIMKKMHELFLAMNSRFNQLMAEQGHYHEEDEWSTHHNEGGKHKGHPSCVSVGSANPLTSTISKLDFSLYYGNEGPTATLICQAKQNTSIDHPSSNHKIKCSADEKLKKCSTGTRLKVNCKRIKGSHCLWCTYVEVPLLEGITQKTKFWESMDSNLQPTDCKVCLGIVYDLAY
ncbi:unnamed protein product [Ilex paraguariensis]|uniref:Uncharacterized protein n=1 Tax=Ilex paraguariensis TaxID=185542 RepID=A0ABC8QT99_9AQUA